MKKRVLKSLCIILTLLTLLCSFALTAHAAKPERTWTISEDLTIVSDGSNSYYLYTLPEEFEWNPLKSYYYYDTDTILVGETGKKLNVSIRTASLDTGIISLRSSGTVRVYATREATQALNAYFSADTHTNCFLLDGSDSYAKIADSVVKLFYVQFEPIDMEVTKLKNLPRYDMVTYDPSGSVCKTVGAIYRLNDQYLGYVDYTLLDNTHFDANGNFSYRSGNVTVSLLFDNAEVGAKSAVEAMESIDFEITYESEADYESVGPIVFWFFFILIGYALPLAPLLVGILLPQSARRGHQKRWYTLTVFAVLWILAATAILIILFL